MVEKGGFEIFRLVVPGADEIELAGSCEDESVVFRETLQDRELSAVKPADCCLVPESRKELTTEGGLDVAGQGAAVRDAVAALRAADIRVSLFIDPEQAQIEASARCGAPVVELHTGGYADAMSGEARARELERIRRAASAAAALGLTVHAGHGLNYQNVVPVAAIPEIVELKPGDWSVALNTQPVQPVYDPNDKVKLYGAYNYDPKFDVLRVPMTVKTGDETVEQFTIGFVNATDSKATLTMAWDRTVATVDIAMGK